MARSATTVSGHSGPISSQPLQRRGRTVGGMSFDVSVTREPQRTRIVVKGRATLGRLLSLLSVLQVDSRDWTAPAVLLDLSGLEGSLAPAEQSQLQQEAHRCFAAIGPVTVRFSG